MRHPRSPGAPVGLSASAECFQALYNKNSSMRHPIIPEPHTKPPRSAVSLPDDDRRLIADLCGRIEELYRLQSELGARLAALEGAVFAARHITPRGQFPFPDRHAQNEPDTGNR
jgi:hypothetical protein